LLLLVHEGRITGDASDEVGQLKINGGLSHGHPG